MAQLNNGHQADLGFQINPLLSRSRPIHDFNDDQSISGRIGAKGGHHGSLLNSGYCDFRGIEFKIRGRPHRRPRFKGDAFNSDLGNCFSPPLSPHDIFRFWVTPLRSFDRRPAWSMVVALKCLGTSPDALANPGYGLAPLRHWYSRPFPRVSKYAKEEMSLKSGNLKSP
jgi:hypothetical protein